jgi:hypothetical protein
MTYEVDDRTSQMEEDELDGHIVEQSLTDDPDNVHRKWGQTM